MRQYSNTAVVTTLNGGISDAATTIVVADATGWPVLAPGERVTFLIGSEIIEAAARSGTTLSGCVRGADGTTAAAHLDGAAVKHVGSAHELVGFNFVHAAGEYHGPQFQRPWAQTVPGAYSSIARPFWVPNTAAYDQIGININVGGDSGQHILRLSIYGDNAGKPGQLIVDAGTVDCSTAGFKGITISQTLKRGLVWLCTHAQGMNAMASDMLVQSAFLPSNIGANALFWWASSDGTAPSTFPTPSLAAGWQATVPILYLRRAA
jgi:hypothetical protein